MSDTATALFFHADAIESEGKDLVGRRSAGQSFLRGYLDYADGDTLNVLVKSKPTLSAFETLSRQMGCQKPVDGIALSSPDDFTRFGSIFFPGPSYLNATWRRQHFDPTACSLVGITHTVSTRGVVENLHELLLQPVEPWDAIICTSRAVQSVVQTQMERQVAFIKQRFGATRVPVPQLPIVPLGINSGDFTHKPDARAALRKAYGADDNTSVVMSMGRLTVVEKANPVPLFMALEEIAQTTGKDIQLWMVGWASRQTEHDLHVAGAQQYCPSVTVHIIDGRDPDVRRDIWSGADIFTLPVDNIQETFGLVPVEAMAAGLPVVMPDWNGFKDTVVHGETGFLIPTVLPGASGIGRDLARRYANGTDGYLHHLMMMEQQTLIDIPAYMRALTDLVLNPDLRKKMGAAGQRHVQAHLDWKVVMGQYQALADDLALMRKGASVTTPRMSGDAVSPIEIDPFALYASYPTKAASGDMRVTHRMTLTQDALTKLDKVNGRAVYKRYITTHDLTLRIAQHVEKTGTTDAAQVAKALKISQAMAIGTLLFLAKFNFVTIDM